MVSHSVDPNSLKNINFDCNKKKQPSSSNKKETNVLEGISGKVLEPVKLTSLERFIRIGYAGTAVRKNRLAEMFLEAIFF